jgi:hypothetical protein
MKIQKNAHVLLDHTLTLDPEVASRILVLTLTYDTMLH